MTSITVIGAGSGNAELIRQHETHKSAQERLWGRVTPEDARTPRSSLFNRPGARPGANLPRDGHAPFRSRMREVVELHVAMELVCEDRQITPDQMLHSHYCAAVAARHMLWTVLLDGGHSASNIARIFSVDHSTVALGIASFREFQKGAVE